jgi:hypothetical protein
MWYSVDGMEKQIIRRKAETKEETIKFRLPKTVYGVIKTRALQERRTMGSEALYLIERGLESIGGAE